MENKPIKVMSAIIIVSLLMPFFIQFNPDNFETRGCVAFLTFVILMILFYVWILLFYKLDKNNRKYIKPKEIELSPLFDEILMNHNKRLIKERFFKEFGSQSFRGYPLEQCNLIWDFFEKHIK